MISPIHVDTWLDAGYAEFAAAGPAALKIEALARLVGISKSSFYHRFGDLDGFQQQLLQRHFDRVRIIAEKERQCKSIDPDLIRILLEHRQDLLFQRRLRMHRSDAAFAECIGKCDQISGAAFIGVWKRDLKLSLPESLWLETFSLALENFYGLIAEDSLNEKWLGDYFRNLKKTLIGLAAPDKIVR